MAIPMLVVMIIKNELPNRYPRSSPLHTIVTVASRLQRDSRSVIFGPMLPVARYRPLSGMFESDLWYHPTRTNLRKGPSCVECKSYVGFDSFHGLQNMIADSRK